MAFAPKPKAAARASRHKVPNVRVSKSGKNTRELAPRPLCDEGATWPVMGDDGPLPVCWLCGCKCAGFGWHLMPPELGTASGASLVYFTLCPRCTPLVAANRFSNTDLLTACGVGEVTAMAHSDAFLTFLREFKVLLELAATERQPPTKDNDPCHSLTTLHRLLTCLEGTLASRSLTTRERTLLTVEQSNLDEQVLIRQGSSGPTQRTKRSSSRAPAVTPKKLSLPQSLGGHDAFTRPRNVPDTTRTISPQRAARLPQEPANAGADFISQLQEEIKRLQESNTEALAKLALLGQQHGDLVVAHELKVQEVKGLAAENAELRSHEAEMVNRCKQLASEVVSLKRQQQPETERIVAGLRHQLSEAETGLGLRPEASRVEIKQSQETRLQAAEEAKQLRQANAMIGERLQQVEGQLYLHQQNLHASSSPLPAAPPIPQLPASPKVISEAASVAWDQEYATSPPQPPYPEPEPVVASPVRREAPSPSKPSSTKTISPYYNKGRQVVWADPSGHTVSFEMDPNMETEVF